MGRLMNDTSQIYQEIISGLDRQLEVSVDGKAGGELK